VFGKSSRDAVDLRHLGSDGFFMSAFMGAVDVDERSVRAAGAGDVNGDGRSDILLGVPTFRFCTAPSSCGQPFPGAAGGSYVVFGKRSSRPIDLLRLRRRGFRIVGSESFSPESFAVAGAGDMNGDKRPEIVLTGSTSSYVVFGGPRSDVRLDKLGARGFRIDGAPGELARGSVSGPADVNGDGRADLFLGTPADFAPSGQLLAEAAVYAVVGKASPETVTLGTLGEAGLQIARRAGGETVTALRDANGDGRPDVLIGARGESHRGRRHAGAVYVVFGGAFREPVDPHDILSTGQGFRIDGPRGWRACCIKGPIGQPGTVSSAGDINRDGKSDVMVGSPFINGHARRESGSAYIVFSP
jgi:hypothetical protein